MEHKKNIQMFVALAWGLTWLIWIPTLLIAYQQDYLLPTVNDFKTLVDEGFVNNQHLLISLIFVLAPYGPFVAAIIVLVKQGRLNSLWRQFSPGNLSMRWILIAIGLALAFPLIGLVIANLAGLMESDSETLAVPLTMILPLFVFQLVTSGMEEPGWRGYLLPALQKRMPPEKSTYILGLLWGIWHWPFVTYFMVLNAPADAPVMGVVISGLIGNVASVMGIAFIYTWMYNHARSLLLVILFHALANTSNAVLLGSVDNPALGTAISIMPWIVAVYLTRRDKNLGYTLTGETSQTVSIEER